VKDVETVTKLISDLAAKRFWGKVEVEYRDGEITILRKSETIKLHGE
jgi:hypothetical protein